MTLQEISIIEFRNKVAQGHLQLVDVREQCEYNRERIPGATLIPLGQLSSRHIELDQTMDTVVYCHSGVRSASAVRFLDGQGFKSIWNLKGGIQAWSQMTSSPFV